MQIFFFLLGVLGLNVRLVRRFLDCCPLMFLLIRRYFVNELKGFWLPFCSSILPRPEFVPKSGSRLKKVCKRNANEIGGGFARETITRHQNRKWNMKCFGNVAKFFRHLFFFFLIFLSVAVFLLSDKYILSPFLFWIVIYSLFSRKQFTISWNWNKNFVGGKWGAMAALLGEPTQQFD